MKKRWAAFMIALASVVTGIVTFTDSVTKIYPNASAWLSNEPVVKTERLPFDTGWIFAGYYDGSLNRYIDGPYVEIVKSNYPDKQALARVGDWVADPALLRKVRDRSCVHSRDWGEPEVPLKAARGWFTEGGLIALSLVSI